MEGTFRLMTIKKKKGILAAGLMKLLHDNKDTEYGKKYDFANIHSIREYQDKVPLCDYDTLEPYIRRMVLDDEENLLCAERPVHYALSSGSVGVPKHIPVSAAELEKYRNYGTCMCIGVVDEYYRNTIGRSFKPGLGADCLELKFQETKYGIPKGAISGNILKQVKGITKYFLTPPLGCPEPDRAPADEKAFAEALDKGLCDKLIQYAAYRNKLLNPCGLVLMEEGWCTQLMKKYAKGNATVAQVKVPVVIDKLP